MKPHIYCAHRHTEVIKGFRTAVSLHGHTLHSQERLDFVPRICERFPVFTGILRMISRRHLARYGRPLDFSRAWWTPPLCARQAIDLEREQIERSGDWNALVSLTDHDSVQAVRSLVTSGFTPVITSIEWTVPYGGSFLHLGVHNLPCDCSTQVNAMAEYTAHPSPDRLGELLAGLAEDPACLIVLNHPAWDEKGIGAELHWNLMSNFVHRYGQFLHAFELNGLRSWPENAKVLDFAQAHGLPVISGGDRHGCEPNAILNLTDATTFSEFAQEIRKDKISRMLFMPQYYQSLRRRLAHTVFDALREHPNHSLGHANWSDRIFYEKQDGTPTSLAQFWDGQPPVLFQAMVSMLHHAHQRPWKSGLRLALGGTEEFVI